MIASQPTGGVDTAVDIERIFATQRRLSRLGAPDAAERDARLARLERAIRGRRGEIEAAVYADFKKAPVETALTETLLTLAEIKHARAHLRRWLKPQPVPAAFSTYGSKAEVRYEPRGVVLILSPWNYPFQLALAPLVAALAAGNRCIVRPSEKAPQTRELIAEIVHDAFSSDEVAVVGGEVETARALLDLPFDHVFFTGSTTVGRIVMQAAAKHLASVTLELGGKSPALVAPDADLAWAAKRIAWGKFVNAGQTCIAPDYALVHESVVEPFIEKVVESTRAMYGASPEVRAANPDYCRIIDDGHFVRVAGLVRDSVSAGAKVEIGGETLAAQRYIAPTVLSNVTFDQPVMREEIFGPVLPVLTYRSIDDALGEINARPRPLALYAFSKGRELFDRILRDVSSGGTVENDTLLHWAHPNLPAGGVGESGMGSYHGRYGFEAFSHRRAVMRQSTSSLAPLLAPPYTRRTRMLLRVLERFS